MRTRPYSTRPLPSLLVAVAIAATGSMSCSDDEATATGTAIEEEAQEDPEVWEASDTIEELPAIPEPNPELVDLLRRIAKGCTVEAKNKAEVESGKLDGKRADADCLKGYHKTFSAWIKKNPREDILETIVGIYYLQEKAEIKKVSAQLFITVFGILDPELREINATRTVARLALRIIADTNDEMTVALTPSVTQAATLAGEQNPLYWVLDNHPSDKVRFLGYRALMYHGRMAAFPRLRRVAEEEGTLLKMAALESVVGMPNPEREEKVVFCPWALEYLKNEDPNIAGAAAKVTLLCGPAYLNKLVEEGEKRRAAGKFLPPLSDVYASICRGYQPNQNGEEICQANFALLRRVIDTESLPPSVRSRALFNIFRQRKDKVMVQLTKRYQKHSLKEVRKEATKLNLRLRGSYRYR